MVNRYKGCGNSEKTDDSSCPRTLSTRSKEELGIPNDQLYSDWLIDLDSFKSKHCKRNTKKVHNVYKTKNTTKSKSANIIGQCGPADKIQTVGQENHDAVKIKEISDTISPLFIKLNRKKKKKTSSITTGEISRNRKQKTTLGGESGPEENKVTIKLSSKEAADSNSTAARMSSPEVIKFFPIATICTWILNLLQNFHF